MIISLGTKETTFNVESELIAKSGEYYELGEQINRGGNATVHECINSDGNVFAVKFMLQLRVKMIKRFEQEISTLKKTNHPHIVRYVDDGIIELKNANGQIKNVRYLIMEKAEENLIDYMKRYTSIGYEVYAPQFRGLSEALGKLHELAVHRDIKPENILVRGETWLIGDLGLCSYIDEKEHLDLTSDNEKIGPKYWLSPEAINNFYFKNEKIGEYSDVYQLCAIFWFVVTYCHPTGVLDKTDWKENDITIYNIIIKSLCHDLKQRPQNGTELYKLICEATLQNC